MKKLLTSILSLTLSLTLFSQGDSHTLNPFWTLKDQGESRTQDLKIKPPTFDLYQLDLSALQNHLSDCKKRKGLESDADLIELSIPVFGGKMERFGFVETPVMQPQLQAKYPNIRSYTAKGLDDARKMIKLEVGPRGLHALIFSSSPAIL